MSKYIKLGTMLKEKRVSKGLTQMELATELGYSSPQFVSNWERGMCSPALESLPFLSKILNISKKEIIDMVVEETRLELEKSFSGKSALKVKKGRSKAN